MNNNDAKLLFQPDADLHVPLLNLGPMTGLLTVPNCFPSTMLLSWMEWPIVEPKQRTATYKQAHTCIGDTGKALSP